MSANQSQRDYLNEYYSYQNRDANLHDSIVQNWGSRNDNKVNRLSVNEVELLVTFFQTHNDRFVLDSDGKYLFK